MLVKVLSGALLWVDAAGVILSILNEDSAI